MAAQLILVETYKKALILLQVEWLAKYDLIKGLFRGWRWARKYPFQGTTSAPPFETNYIFSFGETPGALVKCDLLAKKHRYWPK